MISSGFASNAILPARAPAAPGYIDIARRPCYILLDRIAHMTEDGVEYWLARELQNILGYTQWRRFAETVERAKLSCENSGNAVREMLSKRGIRPEKLPPEEDTKKLECRVKSNEKKIASNTGKLPGLPK
jgi:hypothetical protein